MHYGLSYNNLSHYFRQKLHNFILSYIPIFSIPSLILQLKKVFTNNPFRTCQLGIKERFVIRL